ncbi:hypothetical protein KSP35_01380 [Aquihabitans sp. G128]|uniref:hypothetical protein n=1 Tax=Aquihabitans sp. G128 TaxID=2849779 RepID=UPI001C23B923|nr:hypothetical protein [Aquihabitans sp. G128]QXC61530.1 hypothetical protein KSP35_01380 [Aquihabitans sp. G128]
MLDATPPGQRHGERDGLGPGGASPGEGHQRQRGDRHEEADAGDAQGVEVEQQLAAVELDGAGDRQQVVEPGQVPGQVRPHRDHRAPAGHDRGSHPVDARAVAGEHHGRQGRDRHEAGVEPAEHQHAEQQPEAGGGSGGGPGRGEHVQQGAGGEDHGQQDQVGLAPRRGEEAADEHQRPRATQPDPRRAGPEPLQQGGEPPERGAEDRPADHEDRPGLGGGRRRAQGVGHHQHPGHDGLPQGLEAVGGHGPAERDAVAVGDVAPDDEVEPRVVGQERQRVPDRGGRHRRRRRGDHRRPAPPHLRTITPGTSGPGGEGCAKLRPARAEGNR